MNHQGPIQTDAAGRPQPYGLYDPAAEHDSCGVGFVARLDAQPHHHVVQDAVQILVNLEHRGAVGADKATGDGAGLLLQIPDAFFRQALGKPLPEAGAYAVGMIFLPADAAPAARCVAAVEAAARSEGAEVLAWRNVPTSGSHLGELARSTQPVVRQVFLGRSGIADDAFERKLYVIRRRAEKEVASWTGVDVSPFYISSLSSRTVVYKGMLRGNVTHMRAGEADLACDLLGDDVAKLLPVVVEGGSDSAMFDNVLELLVMAGRSLPHAAMMMVPEAWGPKFHMSDDKRAFYEYHAAIMEPWDGPAALVFTDGRYIGATLDRNGLRPCRYTVTRDGYVVLASETGVLEFAPERILRRGRLQPGKMLLVDLAQNRIVPDNEIKAKVSRQKPYRRWVKDNRIELRGLFTPAEILAEDPRVLLARQQAFGYSEEELKMVVGPMASRGQEAVGSMGNDAALAVLSDRPQLLFAYFKQLFAQVTNPPIDPLREELVMSLMNFVGLERNLLAETPEHVRRLKLPHPILTSEDMMRLRKGRKPDIVARDIDILMPAAAGGPALEQALVAIFAKAERAIAEGANLLVLTDTRMDRDQAPIPVLLATAGLHHYLIRRGLRTRVGIIVESGEVREVMHFALLVGYGASAICPHLALATVRSLAEERLLEQPLSTEDAADNYITAVKKGLLKTFSRMGISTIRSYLGTQIFEAVGIAKAVVDTYFCGTASRVGGIGLAEIAAEACALHRRGFRQEGSPPLLLDVGGQYHVRAGGENHLWSSEAIYTLQHAVRTDDYKAFKRYTSIINDRSRSRVTLRSLLAFKAGAPVPLEEVEPVEAIVRRFVSSAMSFGSISKEAH